MYICKKGNNIYFSTGSKPLTICFYQSYIHISENDNPNVLGVHIHPNEHGIVNNDVLLKLFYMRGLFSTYKDTIDVKGPFGEGSNVFYSIIGAEAVDECQEHALLNHVDENLIYDTTGVFKRYSYGGNIL